MTMRLPLWEGYLTNNQYNQNVRRRLNKLKGDDEE